MLIAGNEKLLFSGCIESGTFIRYCWRSHLSFDSDPTWNSHPSGKYLGVHVVCTSLHECCCVLTSLSLHAHSKKFCCIVLEV
jgi:hypothetical protein